MYSIGLFIIAEASRHDPAAAAAEINRLVDARTIQKTIRLPCKMASTALPYKVITHTQWRHCHPMYVILCIM